MIYHDYSYKEAQKKESSITPTLTKCHTIKEQMAKNKKKVQRIASDTGIHNFTIV